MLPRMAPPDPPPTLEYAPVPAGQDPVTRHDAALVAVRLGAAYVLLQGASGLTTFVAYLSYFPWRGAITLLVPSATYALAGTAAMIYSRRLAEWVLPGYAAAGPPGPLRMVDAQSVGFSIVGLVLLAWSIPPLSVAAVHAAVPWVGTGRIGDLAVAVAQAAMGTVLLVGRRRISRGWSRLRTTSYGSADRAGEGAES